MTYWTTCTRTLWTETITKSEAGSALLLLHTGPPLCVCHLCYKYQYFTKSCIHSPPDCLNKQTCHFTLVPLHFHCTWTPSSNRSPQVSLIFYARFLDWVGFIIRNKDAFLEGILTLCETLQVGAIFVDNMQIFSPPTFFFIFYFWPLPVSYNKYLSA